MGVGVREQTRLEHLVRGRLDAGHHVGGREGDLLDLDEKETTVARGHVHMGCDGTEGIAAQRCRGAVWLGQGLGTKQGSARAYYAGLGQGLGTKLGSARA